MNEPISIGIAGAAGFMGRRVAQETLNLADPTVMLAGAFEAPLHAELGKDLGALAGTGPLGVVVQETSTPEVAKLDVLICFTHPMGLDRIFNDLEETNVALVLGTTGLTEEQEARVNELAKTRSVFRAANFSLGVYVQVQLTAWAASALGPGWDIEIIEMHHRRKVDAPSGTALMLGRAAARARGFPEDFALPPRGGIGELRPDVGIGYAVLRGGDIVGEHHVLLLRGDERIEIVHRATSRSVFAAGAVRAGVWLARGSGARGGSRGPRSNGIYGMDDLLAVDALSFVPDQK